MTFASSIWPLNFEMLYCCPLLRTDPYCSSLNHKNQLHFENKKDIFFTTNRLMQGRRGKIFFWCSDKNVFMLYFKKKMSYLSNALCVSSFEYNQARLHFTSGLRDLFWKKKEKKNLHKYFSKIHKLILLAHLIGVYFF